MRKKCATEIWYLVNKACSERELSEKKYPLHNYFYHHQTSGINVPDFIFTRNRRTSTSGTIMLCQAR